MKIIINNNNMEGRECSGLCQQGDIFLMAHLRIFHSGFIIFVQRSLKQRQTSIRYYFGFVEVKGIYVINIDTIRFEIWRLLLSLTYWIDISGSDLRTFRLENKKKSGRCQSIDVCKIYIFLKTPCSYCSSFIIHSI